jgi:ATP-dependent RNA helicase RhlE
MGSSGDFPAMPRAAAQYLNPDKNLSFATLNLHPDLLRAIKELGFVRPTSIQADAIPPAMAGRDLLACAQTGSGKTAAFLLPILNQLIGTKRGTTRALIVTPTRELAAQIVEDLKDLATHTPVTGAAIFGGVGMGPQEHAFRSGVDVLVATPGRLLDHLKYSYASLDKIEYLVLDEADRMLDMGFLPEIRKILKRVPAKRQTLCFSATMPPPIAVLTREMLNDPARINLERQSTPATGITQAVYPVGAELKTALFLALLQRGDMQEALVFTRTKHRADRLTKALVKAGISADRIHGNRSQAQRTAALAGFKAGKTRVLVATDIVARGIDIEDLGHVVNFDVPAAPEDYVHRIGRTARAAATGDAFTLAAPNEEPDLRNIERVLGKRLPRVLIPDFDYTAKTDTALEIPLAERIAAIRARKSEDRARSKAKQARKGPSGPRADAPAGSRPSGQGSGAARSGPSRGGPARGGSRGGSGGNRGGSGGGRSR